MQGIDEMFDADKKILTGMVVPKCKVCGGNVKERWAGGWECSICWSIIMEVEWETVSAINMDIVS